MRFASVIFISVFLTSCVSVSFGSHETKRASGVRFSEPSSPFVKTSGGNVDGAWKNPHNGNLISYLSDCQDESDPALDSVVSGALTGVSALDFEKRETPTIQGREGLRVLVSGKVDGVATRMDILTFKRDNCLYILSYVGVPSVFSENHAQFDRFIEGFRVP